MQPRARRGPLRRAAVSFGAVWAGEAMVTVALAVVAYLAGGLTAVGAVTAARMAAAALLAPVLGTVGDRVRREHVLTAVGVVRAATLGAAALVIGSGGPPAATYTLVVVATTALTLFRPAHSALLPALASSPADLASANAVRGMLDSVAVLGGPAAAAALLAVTGPAAVFAVAGALSLLGGLVVVRLPYDTPPRAATTRGPVVRELLAGLVTVVRDPTPRLIAVLGVVQTFTRGALSVLVVVLAVDLLDLGEPGVGVLNAAVGAGGVVGSAAAFLIVRRGGLGTWFGVGVALFGAPVALTGVLPTPVAAVLLLAVVGVGNALIDASAFTVLARTTDEAVLVRMFTGFEAVLTLGVAAGAAVAPWAVRAVGTVGALAVVGLLAPVTVVAALPALRRLDRALRVRDTDVALLRSGPLFATLPVATLESLAARLDRASYRAGVAVVQEGDPGVAYFVVESGEVVVERGGAVVNRLGPGDGFGEIALLDDRPRTATVRAVTEVRVAVLARPAFLTAVTGYPAAARVAAAEVGRVADRDAVNDRRR
ncbi:cyclic nucleotide-binding domain-containing protein [Jatrophihabitans sp. YIM 134969]